MAIVKIQTVKQLNSVVKYSLQTSKTEQELVSCFECDEENINDDFEVTQNKYNKLKNVNKDLKARMIIQSFDNRDNITPEQVHQFGKDLAKSYLKNEHQYMVVTHIDSDNLHNHIIFNSVKLDGLSMFDSTRQHTINDLRKVNDEIAIKNHLLIPEIKQNKGIQFQEYYVRANNKSYKSKLENTIDKTIRDSKSYDEFLKNMEKQGYEVKTGKHISFKHSSAKRFTRSKSLGIDYNENSIKYRINNKDFIPIKTNYINKNWIDKTDKKFKDNYYLKRWASKQNIQYLSEVTNKMYRENLSLNDIQEIQNINFSIVEKFTKQVESLDSQINKLETRANCFDDYKGSYNLIKDYKQSENKERFKQEHYSQFKKYDIAKKNIYLLKKEYGITEKAELINQINELEKTRKELYSTLGKNREKEIEKTRQEQAKRTKEQQNKRAKEQEHER